MILVLKLLAMAVLVVAIITAYSIMDVAAELDDQDERERGIRRS